MLLALGGLSPDRHFLFSLQELEIFNAVVQSGPCKKTNSEGKSQPPKSVQRSRSPVINMNNCSLSPDHSTANIMALSTTINTLRAHSNSRWRGIHNEVAWTAESPALIALCYGSDKTARIAHRERSSSGKSEEKSRSSQHIEAPKTVSRCF